MKKKWKLGVVVLYVKKDEIPQETAAALTFRGGKANIYILGPASVVSNKVEAELGQYGKVVRIAGKNPYENAVAFAQYKDPDTGFGWGITTPGHNFSFVNKDSAALAIAAAPFPTWANMRRFCGRITINCRMC